jgi:hypothetical protein
MSPAKLVTILFILPIALIIDIVGIVLVIFGLDDFGLTDILGITLIGGWFFGFSMFSLQESSGVEIPSLEEKRSNTKELKEQFNKTAKKQPNIKTSTTKNAKWAQRMKWIRPLSVVGELIPYLGCLPWWTVWVICELKYGDLSKI